MGAFHMDLAILFFGAAALLTSLTIALAVETGSRLRR